MERFRGKVHLPGADREWDIELEIDWEHKEARWIKPEDINSYETVPRLRETLARVYDI